MWVPARHMKLPAAGESSAATERAWPSIALQLNTMICAVNLRQYDLGEI